MVRVEVDDIITGYEEKEILKEVTFELERGGFLGIVGPNGSGKSTLIRAMTRVIPAWKGSILYDGKDIEEMNREGIARKAAVVPQDTFINFPFTTKEVVLMGRSPYLGRFENPDGEDKEIARRAMESTKTIGFKDRSVRELSGGELQRVVLARALTQEPDLLLLDEATSHLDIGNKKEVMDTIKEKNEKEDLSVVSVHHNLNLAARYCKKILLLDEGEKQAFGSPEEVLTNSNLRAVYGIEAEVHEHPRDGSLYVSPVEEVSHESNGERIHVVCGGDSAGTLLKSLVEEGYEVTAGVLNVMDSDLEKADFLDIETVSEAPFSTITQESYRKNIQMIEKADTVIVTDFPVGEGNLRNLEAVREAIEDDKELILIDPKNIDERDYTENKKASELYDDIKDEKDFKGVKSTEGAEKLL